MHSHSTGRIESSIECNNNTSEVTKTTNNNNNNKSLADCSAGRAVRSSGAAGEAGRPVHIGVWRACQAAGRRARWPQFIRSPRSQTSCERTIHIKRKVGTRGAWDIIKTTSWKKKQTGNVSARKKIEKKNKIVRKIETMRRQRGFTWR